MLALFQEHGPVVFPDGSDTAVKNPYSWNTKANVLYIESPLGVGFNLGSLGTISDKTVTADNLVFLQNWYKMWPQFKKNRLFLVGESYAGIYVPWFANAVVEANKTAADKIPLEGIMVGNGCTD
jgi:serine carboxypeptidase-like clade 2